MIDPTVKKDKPCNRCKVGVRYPNQRWCAKCFAVWKKQWKNRHHDHEPCHRLIEKLTAQVAALTAKIHELEARPLSHGGAMTRILPPPAVKL